MQVAFNRVEKPSGVINRHSVLQNGPWFGNASHSDSGQPLPSSGKKRAAKVAAVLALGGALAFLGNMGLNIRNERIRTTEEQAAKKQQQEQEAFKSTFEKGRNLIQPIFEQKMLAPRVGPTGYFGGAMKDLDFVDVDAEADWQIIPNSGLGEKFKQSLDYEVESLAVEYTRYGRDKQPFNKELFERIADNKIKELWKYNVEYQIGAHASRFLKKHTAQEWVDNIDLRKQFVQEFHNGGTDFEGKQAPGFKQHMADLGVQVNSFRLKGLKVAFDRIVLKLEDPAKP